MYTPSKGRHELTFMVHFTFGSIKTLVNHELKVRISRSTEIQRTRTKTFGDFCLLYKQGKPEVTSLAWE